MVTFSITVRQRLYILNFNFDIEFALTKYSTVGMQSLLLALLLLWSLQTINSYLPCFIAKFTVFVVESWNPYVGWFMGYISIFASIKPPSFIYVHCSGSFWVVHSPYQCVLHFFFHQHFGWSPPCSDPKWACGLDRGQDFPSPHCRSPSRALGAPRDFFSAK